MAIAIPSQFKVVRDGTHVPRRRTVASRLRQQPGSVTLRNGACHFWDPRDPVDKHPANLGAQPESDQTREPLTVATRPHELVDLDQRHTSSLTGSYVLGGGSARDASIARRRRLLRRHMASRCPTTSAGTAMSTTKRGSGNTRYPSSDAASAATTTTAVAATQVRPRRSPGGRSCGGACAVCVTGLYEGHTRLPCSRRQQVAFSPTSPMSCAWLVPSSARYGASAGNTTRGCSPEMSAGS